VAEMKGLLVADGEYWRLVTSGFLHANLWHIGLNMYLLWILGGMLEPAIGKVRFLVVYFTALLGGAFGALVVSPLSPTVGASGAIFGLMGATAVVMHRRGINIFEAGIGGLILINLVLSFVIPGISVGGHLGGLVAGALAMLAIHEADRHRQPVYGYIAAGVVAAAMVVGSILVADASQFVGGYTGINL
jgi:membrane associated rhomboid family serine protease